MKCMMLWFINKQETLHNCRHEGCKKRVGNQGGLLRKKAASLTVILEGTGRVGIRGIGNPVLTFLVNTQPILMLTQLHKFSSLFYLRFLPAAPNTTPFWSKYTFVTIFMITTSFSIQQIWLITAFVYRYIDMYKNSGSHFFSTRQPPISLLEQLLFLLSDASFKVGLRRDDVELCMKIIVGILIISGSQHSTLSNRMKTH